MFSLMYIQAAGNRNKIQVKSGIKENEKDMGEVDQSEVEESDYFEDCELKEKITPIFLTMLTYEHLPTTGFNPV